MTDEKTVTTGLEGVREQVAIAAGLDPHSIEFVNAEVGDGELAFTVEGEEL